MYVIVFFFSDLIFIIDLTWLICIFRKKKILSMLKQKYEQKNMRCREPNRRPLDYKPKIE